MEDDLIASPERGEEVTLTISKSLSETERELVQELLSTHRKLLGQGRAKDAEIRLEIGHTYPPFRMDPKKLQIMNEGIKKLMKIGVVRPSKCPWELPALLVRKKDGGVRFCIDL